ncbi:hypothetical protein GC194_11635 [bacterium]|nr:hypothetical protein [bacterium]
MVKVLFSLAIASTVFFSACSKKDNNDYPVKYSDKELALQGGEEKYWLLSKELYNGEDITASFQPCEMDNVFKFDIYKNYSVDAGPTTCENNPEPDVVRGSYELDETKNTLKISTKDSVFTATLLDLETSKLRWQVEVGGETIEQTFVPK